MLPTLRTAGWEARSGQFTLWEWHLCVRDTQCYTSQFRALLASALRSRLLQAGPPSLPGGGIQSPPGAVAHPQGIRVWGIPDPHPQPLRTEMHWPTQRRNTWGAFPRMFSAPNPTVHLSQGTDLAVSRCLPCILRGWSFCRGKGRRSTPGGWNAETVNPSLAHRSSGCCSLLLLVLKTSAGEDPSRFPCLWVGCVSRRAVLKGDSAGLERDVGFSAPILFCSRCSSKLCGSFWLHTVQGTSRTSPCSSLLFLFAASVAFYPSLTGCSLTAFLLRRPFKPP